MKALATHTFLEDEVILEVRRIKEAIAAEHNYDVIALARSIQAQEAERLAELAATKASSARCPS